MADDELHYGRLGVSGGVKYIRAIAGGYEYGLVVSEHRRVNKIRKVRDIAIFDTVQVYSPVGVARTYDDAAALWMNQ